jgi:catechol 2,3-dioxygenase-like lactoylglutathione lyase family enzyme
MKITRILHHSVNVEGHLDRETEFYRSVLSLEEVERPEIPGVAGRWFSVGDAQVHLVDAPAGSEPIRPTGPHECFGVEDLDQTIAELKERGISYRRASQGQTVQIWIVSPLGNTIELQQDPTYR